MWQVILHFEVYIPATTIKCLGLLIGYMTTGLPVWRRYSTDFRSTAKNPVVAPYSGHMLEMVALSAMDRAATPGP